MGKIASLPTADNSDDYDVFTSRRHSIDYFTVDGVKLRTGYHSVEKLYLLPIREWLDNACDFLRKHYRGAKDAYIKVWITKDDRFIRIRVSNSNSKPVQVFKDKDIEPIFDFEGRYGSKQDVHIISAGMLGDALKQILSLGYVLIHVYDDGDSHSFENKQWKYPLIIRHNGIERKVYLDVFDDNSGGKATVEPPEQSPLKDSKDIELEVTLPNIGLLVPKSYFVGFCARYTIFTTDISFEFTITDNSTNPQISPEETQQWFERTTHIVLPAIHPISNEKWTNTNRITSYRPQEFTRRFVNVHNKSSVTVYDNILRTFREGSNLPKTPETSITVEQLMSDPGRFKKIEKWYNQLRNIAVQKFYPYDPKDGKVKDRLSLPYATKGRREALVSRVAQIFDININEEYYNSKPAYKLVHGFYDGGGIQFPYAFEILVAPYRHPLQHDTIFIGAINYSVSPLSNRFEGYYGKDSENNPLNDISKLLEAYGFYQGFTTPGIRIPKSKLSSVIVANLITLRRDPQGYDKSRIDILPFAKTIIEAVAKVSSEIKTFQGAHFRFINDEDKNTGKQDGESKDEKVTIKNLLEEFLIEKRGLPAAKKRRRIQ